MMIRIAIPSVLIRPRDPRTHNEEQSGKLAGCNVRVYWYRRRRRLNDPPIGNGKSTGVRGRIKKNINA